MTPDSPERSRTSQRRVEWKGAVERRLGQASGVSHPKRRAQDIVDEDLRRVRTRASGCRVQRGTAGAQTEHKEVRGLRGCRDQLVLMTKGRARSEEDDCPICQLPSLPHERSQSTFMACCTKRVCNGCILAAGKRGWTTALSAGHHCQRSTAKALQ